MTGWTIEELPSKLRDVADGDGSEDEHDLMRMAANEIERLRQWQSEACAWMDQAYVGFVDSRKATALADRAHASRAAS